MLKVPAVLCVCAAAWCSQALAAAAALAAAGGRSDGGNFLDDKQWLTTISQYDKEVGQWNKFRDVSAARPHPRTHERAAAGPGRRRPGLGGGQWSRFPEQPGRRRRGCAPRLEKLAVPVPPPGWCKGKGFLAGGTGVQVSPGSPSSSQHPALPPWTSPPGLRRFAKCCLFPSQLLNGISGSSKHSRCAFCEVMLLK